MNDWFSRTYHEMLEVIPSEQRIKFQSLVNAHGLKPDDPSIVCVMLMFLLICKLTDRLKNIEDALDSEHMRRGVAYVSFFTKVAQKTTLVAVAFAAVTISACAGVAWTVHHFDASAEHQQACADEAAWTIQLVNYAHRKGYLNDVYHVVTRKPKNCT